MLKLNKDLSFLLVILFFALISYPILGKSGLMRENFATLDPGSFPESVSEPILYEDYPVKKNPGISMNTYEDNYPYYPLFGSSYKQVTNNVRYWATPNNGKCSPAEFCVGIYDNKKIDTPKSPVIIPFSSPVKRVNFYGSHDIKC